MSELGDLYKETKNVRKKIRSDTKKEVISDVMKLLMDNHISFNTSNEGIHLVVGEGRADLWPTTDRWYIRKTKKKGFGVAKLIKELSKTTDITLKNGSRIIL